MLVTLEFKDLRGKQTELTLTHEKFASVEEAADRHNEGLDSLP